MEEIWSGKENFDDDLSNFLKDMPNKLSWRSPRHMFGDIWVFWSEEHQTSINSDHPVNLTNHGSIQLEIKSSLSAINIPGFEDVLVQFWAPTITKTGDPPLLTTALLPFALKNIKGKLAQYRKHCLSHSFVIADGEGELTESLPGRVFRNQFPEFSPDLSYYSVKEYPQLDLALSCGISQTVALPVFEASRHSCVGVLEILLTTDAFFILCQYADMANSALKEVGLETIDPRQLRIQTRAVYIGHIEEEIKEAMGQVCEIHHLPLACVWVRCACRSSVGDDGNLDRSCNDFDVNGRGELLVSVPNLLVFGNVVSHEFCEASKSFPLRVGQGLVGNCFLLNKPILCRDVTQFNISEYPMMHSARKAGFTSCLTIPLQCIATGNLDYVLEFFLSRGKTYSGDLHNLLSSILAILQQHLKSSAAITGDPGNVLLTEVYKLRESFVEASLGKGKNVIRLEQSNSAFTSFKTMSNSKTLEGECSETKDSAESLHSIESTLNSTCRKPDIYIGPFCSRSKIDSSPIKFNHEHDLDHILPDAQNADFDIGFKKHHDHQDILKKSETVGMGNSATASSYSFTFDGRMMSANHCQIPLRSEGWARSSSSDFPLSEASAVVASTVPPCTLVVDEEMVTIKVKYEEDFIIFSLPSSSSMADLTENVSGRLHMLKDKAFFIKYQDDSGDWISLSTDVDLHDCMARVRSGAENMIRMLVQPFTATEAPRIDVISTLARETTMPNTRGRKAKLARGVGAARRVRVSKAKLNFPENVRYLPQPTQLVVSQPTTIATELEVILTEVYKLRESLVEASPGKVKNVIRAEQSNSAFTSFKTMSNSKTLEGERSETKDSAESLHSIESTLNSTCRKHIYIGPFCSQSKIDSSPIKFNHVHDLDHILPDAQNADFDIGFKKHHDHQDILKKSETVGMGNSATASSFSFTFDGRMMSANHCQIPLRSEGWTRSSSSDFPLCEASAVVASTVPPCTLVVDEEMITIKVKYEEDFIIFSLPSSSSMADLTENVSGRLHMLKDKAFFIKYQDDSGDWISLSTDVDLHDCMARARSGAENMVRMLVQPFTATEAPRIDVISTLARETTMPNTRGRKAKLARVDGAALRVRGSKAKRNFPENVRYLPQPTQLAVSQPTTIATELEVSRKILSFFCS